MASIEQEEMEAKIYMLQKIMIVEKIELLESW